MKTSTLLTALAVAITFTAAPALAEDRAAIENAQKTLKEKGHFTGTVDGVMGPKTTAALRAYQKEQGLDVTGRLDGTTLAKLGADTSGDPAAKRGEQSAKPAKDDPASGPSGSPKTSGDTKPSAVDPAQASKTGANAGEGASYSRSNDKGESAMPRQETDKK